MKATISTIRAVGAEFARRLWWPVAIGAACVSLVAIGGVWWLTSAVSSWWGLLFFPVSIAVAVATVILGVYWRTIRYISPIKTDDQRTATRQFVDQLQSAASTMQTPRVVLLFKIVRDIAAPRESGFVGSLSRTSKSLSSDFRALNNLFKP